VQPAQAQPAPALGQPPPAEAKKMRRVKALVSGRVQNVGFRAFTTGQANQLGLTGYVFNLKDGRVEAVIEGPDDKVEQLIRAIKTGPPGARVDGVQLEEQPHRGEFRSFTIGR
jgi:acylphosphatase